MNALDTPVERILLALEGEGWRREGMVLSLPGEKITLRALPSGEWFRIWSSDLPLPGEGPLRLLEPGLQPAGPYKLLRGERPGTAAVAADLPLSLLDDPAEEPLDLEGDRPPPEGDLLGPWGGGLVQAVRERAGAAQARPDGESVFPPPAVLSAWLGRQGWPSREDRGQVRVTLPGTHGFRQVRVRPGREGGPALVELELADASAWPEVSLAALGELAAEANRRLRLVRLAWLEEGGRRVGLQVNLGRLPVEPWLPLALNALGGAALYLGDEVPALADPALAEDVVKSPLSGSAA